MNDFAVAYLARHDGPDFTALCDTVNVAARLGSDAGAGELPVSDAAWLAADRGEGSVRRTLALKGRAEPLDVVVLRAEERLAPAG